MKIAKNWKKRIEKLIQLEEKIGVQIPSDNMLKVAVEQVADDNSKVLTFKEHLKSPKDSVGINLEKLKTLEIEELLKNESALIMLLHSYRETLIELKNERENNLEAKREIELLNDKLKERNVATFLILLGQIQIGFGTNLITNGIQGGWFLFISGLCLNIGALFIYLFRSKSPNH